MALKRLPGAIAMHMQPHTAPLSLPHSCRTAVFVHNSSVGRLELNKSLERAIQEYTCRPLVQYCTKSWHIHFCPAKSHGHSILCPCGPAIEPTSPTKRPVQIEQALRQLGTGAPGDLDAPLCRMWVYIPTYNTTGWSRPSLGCSTCPRMAISAIRG